jgi:hypothetical protein
MERTIGSEIILDAPDGTPFDVGHVESHFGMIGDLISIGASQVQGLRQTNHRLRNHFGCTQ